MSSIQSGSLGGPPALHRATEIPYGPLGKLALYNISCNLLQANDNCMSRRYRAEAGERIDDRKTCPNLTNFLLSPGWQTNRRCGPAWPTRIAHHCWTRKRRNGSMQLFPSACIWLHEPPIDDALKRLKITAYHFVDASPSALEAPGVQDTLKGLGLKVSCVVLDSDLPSGLSLDGKEDGKRLGYVQLNDNDGKKDRHWALLDGRLTMEDLIKTLAALKKAGYGSTLGLELKPKPRISLISDFSRNHNLILRILGELEKL